jgi:RNA polymerase sigma-70 factor, ECF subfamily
MVMVSQAPLPDHDLEVAWHRFADDLYRFIIRRVDSPQDAEDIRQLVFTRLASQNKGLRADERVAAWLYTTTRNAITDHYRSAPRRREMPVEFLPDVADAAPDGTADTSEANLARCLLPLVNQLPTDQAEAIRMVDLEGMTHAKAAALAVVSVPGMKSRVQRGRGKLRNLLLACCQVHQDVRGRVMDFDGCSPEPSPDSPKAATESGNCRTC